jgi:hypothetical protein
VSSKLAVWRGQEVTLTGNEVTIVTGGASSLVAAVAIVAGYLSTKNANRNALQIVREERHANRKYELEDVKRASYSKTMGALNDVGHAMLGMDKVTSEKRPKQQFSKMQAADVAAHSAINELELLAPTIVAWRAWRTLDEARKPHNADGFTRMRDLLLEGMQEDLGNHAGRMTAPVPAEEEARTGNSVSGQRQDP